MKPDQKRLFYPSLVVIVLGYFVFFFLHYGAAIAVSGIGMYVMGVVGIKQYRAKEFHKFVSESMVFRGIVYAYGYGSAMLFLGMFTMWNHGLLGKAPVSWSPMDFVEGFNVLIGRY